jgi:ribosome maturation factor RimP
MRSRDTQEVADRVEAIAAPIVRALALDLVEVECSGQGAGTVLRVFIDKPGGVSVHDCEQVHLSLGQALDVEDPIPHGYTLEVSSPGLDRPLKQRKDYLRALGKQVNVKLTRPCEGQWRIVGRLLDVDDQGLTVALRPAKPKSRSRGDDDSSRQARLEWGDVAAARLEVEW